MKEQDYSKDAALVIETIESVHPIFLLDDMLAKNYDEIRNAFLSETSKPMAREDFAMAISRYIRVLKDGHMAGRKMRERFNLDVKWAVRDDRLFLLDKDGLPSNKEVVAIGGISVKSIFNAVDKHHFSENYVDRQIVLGQRSRGVWMLKYSGVKINGKDIELTINDSGDITTITKSLVRNKTPLTAVMFNSLIGFIVRHKVYDQIFLRRIFSKQIIRYEIKDDVFTINLRFFVDCTHVDKVAEAVKEAVKNGMKKFIVDIRGNEGGNSNAGKKLLAAMGIQTPKYGTYTRVSDMAVKQRANWDGFEDIALYKSEGCSLVYSAPDKDTAQNSNNIFISVLTDNKTYSSATMFAVWVADGGFGNIVGEPSRNAVSDFGDTLSLRLPQSGLNLGVSHKRFLRPDSNADPDIVMPDIMVDSKKAFDHALDFLRNMK